MAANNPKSSVPKAGSLKAWLYTVVVAGLIFFVFLEVFILFVIGMAPTFGAFVIDRTHRRYFTMTVAFPNGVGVLPSAIKLFSGGSGGVDVALELVSDPLVLFTMYAAGAVGWFIHFIVPPFVAIWLSMSNEMKSMAIKKRQKELIENWGKEIRAEAAKQLPDEVRLADGIGEEDDEDNLEGGPARP
ncbi:MAG TPA: hypothetical protein DCS82_03015 [Rhodospirillaceae bacterium]|nr:hypothetical protein [Rhodospirillaceae bacterium]HAA92631.1 hypothetical protein [Rhodospirillaceae bacterium]HAT34662.1 hypothetical protein [Rhodospirillaceae bacterium]|tara:strand:- start:92 stop:652 length:561 start_codon:yes stop_codon:yes gene_type:complete